MARVGLVKVPPDGLLLTRLAHEMPGLALDLVPEIPVQGPIAFTAKIQGVTVTQAVEMARRLAPQFEGFEDLGVAQDAWRFRARMDLDDIRHPLWCALLGLRAYQETVLVRIDNGVRLYVAFTPDVNLFFLGPRLADATRDVGGPLRFEVSDLDVPAFEAAVRNVVNFRAPEPLDVRAR